MKVKEYEAFIVDNAFMGLDDEAYNLIGLCGETGEVAEWFKKAVYRQDSRFTEDMLKSELGDVLHYLTRITLSRGWCLKDLMADNVAKLAARRRKDQEKLDAYLKNEAGR